MRREVRVGGADEDRTHDLLNAIQALSQTELRPHSRQVAWLTPRVRQNSGGCYHEPVHAQAQLRQAALGGSGVFAVRSSAAPEGPALRGAHVGFAAAPGRRAAGAAGGADAGWPGGGCVQTLRAWQLGASRPLRLRQISASRPASDLRLRSRARRRRLRAFGHKARSHKARHRCKSADCRCWGFDGEGEAAGAPPC